MKLFINNQIFTEREFLGFEPNDSFAEYINNTLLFCKDWFQGKTEFKVFTSGSTGVPKEITISREQMIFSATKTCDFLDLTEKDTALISLSIASVGGKMMLVRSFIKNLDSTLITPCSNPLENIDTSFDFLSFVPMQIYEIIKNTPQKVELLNQAKAIIIGGGEVSCELEAMLDIIKAPVYSTYGMTETVSHIALRRLNGIAKKDFFTVFEDVEISIDTRNCLTIKSEVTNNEILKTNDIVELLDNKNFRWIGRIDNIINSGGIKIQIETLEKKIKQIFDSLGYKERFFATSEKDIKLGEKIILVIEKEFMSKNYFEKIFMVLKKSLSKYEAPKTILNSKEFILTQSGKIDKKSTLKNLN